MAQSITDIQNEMLAEKANHPELTALDSVSNTAIWRLWMYVTAVIITFFEEVMDLFKIDIQNIIDNNQYGTDSWWYNKLLAFQYGDLLVYLNNIFQYAAIDPTKQIIGFCSVSSLNGIVQIKVAANVGGQPGVLNNAQLNGVVSYCSQIVPAGIRFSVLSLAADLLKIYGTVYYDAAGDISIIQPAVEAAIQAYLVGLNAVVVNASGVPASKNFDGTLFVNKLIDAIQAVPGVIGDQFKLDSISAKNGGGVYTQFTVGCQPESGYFTIDPAFTLAATLTYTPYIKP